MQRSFKVIIVILNYLIIGIGGFSTAQTISDNTNPDSIYNQAQKFYYNKQYDQALASFAKFIHESKNIEIDQPNILWSIDQIGRIYLREKRDPDTSIKFFNDILKEHRLTEAEEDVVSGWISAAQDWKTAGQFPQMTQDANKQFELGEQFFQSGTNKIKLSSEKAGNADFAIAQSYLLPFIVNNDSDKRKGDALFMMGEIRRRLWNDKTYWAENYYFTEVIRRFPHTELSWKAYLALEGDVQFGYSGSGGNFTPESVIKWLKMYKSLAMQN